MYKNAAIPARCAPPAPGSRPFKSSCKPYLNLDSRFTVRFAGCPGMTRKGFTLHRYSELVSESSKKGFTLIELLVVVLIIGILSAVALPQYQTVVAKTRLSEHMQQLFAIRRAQEVYYMANGTYAVSLEELDVDAKGKCSLGENDPSLLMCPYASADNITSGVVTPDRSQILSSFYSGGYPGWGSSVKPDVLIRVYFANSSKPNQVTCSAVTQFGKGLCATLP